MPGDASEDEPQVGFRVEPVELGRADQAVDGRGALTARLFRAATVNGEIPALTDGIDIRLDESVWRAQRQEAISFLLDHRIALAGEPFQSRPVQYVDVATAVLDYAELLELAGSLCHPFTAYPKHASDQLLGHD
jgi:hypothetical protein